MRTDVFLRAGAELERARGAVRRAHPGDPLRRSPRELAWCHVLASAGRYRAAVRHLRAVLRDAAGADPPDLVSIGEMLELLHRAVSARYPAALARPAA